MSPPLLARTLGALAVAALVLFAGCLGAADTPAPADDTPFDPDPTATTGPSDTPAPSPEPTTGPGSDPEPPTGGNNTTGNGTADNTTGDNTTGNQSLPEHTWPNINSAQIRPGVAILVGNSLCTANFVFRDRVNGTIYVGTAAHCVDGLGQTVKVIEHGVPLVTYTPGPTIGKVVYSSWETLPNGAPNSALLNDFALIEVAPSSIDLVHPAMLYFGGPTALAEGSSFSTGQKVLSAGNTPLRPGPNDLDRLEGKIVSPGSTWSFDAYFVPYTWGGDSGSGVMTGSGKAAGILVRSIGVGTGPAVVYTSYDVITKLDPALEHAAKHGFDVELQTWELLDDGRLP